MKIKITLVTLLLVISGCAQLNKPVPCDGYQQGDCGPKKWVNKRRYDTAL